MITFSGYRLSSLQQDMLAEAAEFTLLQFMSKRLLNSLNIQIHVVKDLYSKELTWGDVEMMDDGEKSPKEFFVRINYSGVRSFYKMIEILVHEMVHVKQYAKRQMRHLRDPFLVAYEKEHYSTIKTPYIKRPWEIEAHAFELPLTHKFLEKSKRVNRYVIEKSDVEYMKGL